MGKVILGFTQSLDGFTEDSEGSFGPLYMDMSSLKDTTFMKESILKTGSVVMSRKEFEMAENPDLYADNYEFQVPIYVFTDKKPDKHPKENDKLTITFVTEGIESAVNHAKVAAGAKDVTVIGSAITTPLCLKANLADELHVDIVPVILNEGFRPFDEIGDIAITLERMRVTALPESRTHLSYKISS